MGSFRIGRKHAQHVYPERNPGLLPPPLALNLGVSWKTEFPLSDTPEAIPWSAIGSVFLWDMATTYQTGDIVSHMGQTWISLQDNNTGNDPAFSPLFWDDNTIVPITPRSTGLIVIQGVIGIEQNGVGLVELFGSVWVNGAELLIPGELEAKFDDTIDEVTDTSAASSPRRSFRSVCDPRFSSFSRQTSWEA